MGKPAEIIIVYSDDALPYERLEELFDKIVELDIDVRGAKVTGWVKDNLNYLEFYFPEGVSNDDQESSD